MYNETSELCPKCQGKMKPSKFDGGKSYCPKCYKAYKERQEQSQPKGDFITKDELRPVIDNILKRLKKLEETEQPAAMQDDYDWSGAPEIL